MMESNIERQPVILFDGICNLCNASVIFILRHERRPDFQFESIQSEAGRGLLKRYGFPAEYSQALILIEEGKVYSGSTAALKIGQALRFPWSFLSLVGLIVPKFIRDWIYRQIAKHRYQWFGKREACLVQRKH
jgi:predicted DCC family thiol-disulfide oxidoreductase YuxK